MRYNDIVLTVRSLKKSFGPVDALVEGDLTLERGKITALVGNNGAGKTTLIKCITGALRPDYGYISLRGEATPSLTLAEARRRGIATVYQDLALVDVLDVASNIWLGMEPSRWGIVDREVMRRHSIELLKRFAIDLPSVANPVSDLSGGQRQAVALARAIAQGGDILILDEPTSAMGIVERSHIVDAVKKLRKDGQAILYISHDMEQVLETADEVVIMRNGRTIACIPVGELDPLSLAGWISGAIS
jgi:ABC-type sugar transport system ATPase subunit